LSGANVPNVSVGSREVASHPSRFNSRFPNWLAPDQPGKDMGSYCAVVVSAEVAEGVALASGVSNEIGRGVPAA
jgi:hypothetical protein